MFINIKLMIGKKMIFDVVTSAQESQLLGTNGTIPFPEFCVRLKGVERFRRWARGMLRVPDY